MSINTDTYWSGKMYKRRDVFTPVQFRCAQHAEVCVLGTEGLQEGTLGRIWVKSSVASSTFKQLEEGPEPLTNPAHWTRSSPWPCPLVSRRWPCPLAILAPVPRLSWPPITQAPHLWPHLVPLPSPFLPLLSTSGLDPKPFGSQLLACLISHAHRLRPTPLTLPSPALPAHGTCRNSSLSSPISSRAVRHSAPR